MSYPPTSENTAFLCYFNGAVGATEAENLGLYANDPVFLGGAEIDDDQSWCFSTYIHTDADGAGAFEISGISGIDLNADDFFIEAFLRNNNPGGNDVIFSVGGNTADEKYIELAYDNLGNCVLRTSTDGVNFVEQNVSFGNATGWRYFVLQKAGGLWSFWGDGIGGSPENPNPATAPRGINNYNPGALFSGSTQPIVFGARRNLSLPNEGGFSTVRIAIGEPYTDPFQSPPATIPIPKCSSIFVNCTPQKSIDIPTAVTLFLDEEYSRDFSYFFASPDGEEITYSASDLPPGLAMAANGVISGAIVSPATEGTVYTSTLLAVNICGEVSGTLTFTVGTTVTAGGESFNFLHSGS